MPPATRKLAPGSCTGAVPAPDLARRGAPKGGRSSTSPGLLLLAVLVLAGCASGPDDGGAAPSSSAPSSEPPTSSTTGADELVVEIDRGNGSELERYTLVCTDPPTGDLPDVAAACAHLRGMTDPFARLEPGLICTEQYGGPQTARITGRWAGADVDLRLSRTNGCRISQWDGLGPLLPGPVG